MNRSWLFFLALLSSLVGVDLISQTPLPNAHAHNDYEHKRPLLDALDQGFTSVEADVWLINGTLYVYHDKPENPDPARSLEALYLQPVSERIAKNEGSVYLEYDQFFYLMIDFKSEAQSTYQALKPLLLKYSHMLAAVRNGQEEKTKPVKVFISGSRPVQEILNELAPLAALDGRPEDLGKGIPASLMPVVSQSMLRYSRWRGKGEMSAEDREKIKAFVDAAHAEGKKVRFWANPDNEKGWQQLINVGVDLINTDKLSALRLYLEGRK